MSTSALEPTQPSMQLVQKTLSLVVRRPGREADHSPPSNTEMKNVGSWFELSNNSDAPFHCRVQVMYIYSWDNPANLRNREVRNHVKRGTSVIGKSLALMEPGCSLPCSQEFAPFRYPGPPESVPHRHALFNTTFY